MAVLTNTMLQGSSADTEETPYQIKKSLRFDLERQSYMKRTGPQPGNQRTWTISFWAKVGRSKDNNPQCFYAGAFTFRIWAHRFELYSEEGGSVSGRIESDNVGYARDPSAWAHYCLMFNTTNLVDGYNRMAGWVNGREIILRTSTATWPTLNRKIGGLNTTTGHEIGHSNLGYTDMYFADYYFLDGLALTPAAFGKWDATGVWQPKKFSVPTPNNGTTWSSTLVNDQDNGFNNSTAATNLFDGSITTQISGNGNFTFTAPGDGIPYSHAVEVYLDDSSTYERARVNSHTWVDLEHQKWTKVHLGSGNLQTLKFQDNRGTNFDTSGIRAIRVDGKILEDGVTDITPGTNPNNGTEWSSGTESGTALGSSDDADNAFDGIIDDSYSMLPATGSTYSVTLPHSVTVKKRVRLHCHTGSANAKAKVYITPTGGSNTAYSTTGSFANAVWKELFTGTGELTKIEVVADGSNRAGIQAVEVDGYILEDSIYDNSFHLDFNDTSKDRYLGKDVLNGKIAAATGGLPIYNTDATGDVKKSGYRSDSSAGTTDGTGLVFALPGDALTDEHDHINTGSSAVALSAQGNVRVSGDQSRFYGSSIDFPGTSGSDHFIKSTSSNADFTFGTGNFTIEFWMRKDASQNRNILQMHSAEGIANNYTGGFVLDVDGNEQLNVWMGKDQGGTEQIGSGNNAISIGKWHHVAFTRTNDVFKWYVDGVLIKTHTMVTTENLNSTYIVIGGGYTNSYNWDGNLQDFRIYKGVVKYSTNFKAPIRNDWDVYNLNAAKHTYSLKLQGSADTGNVVLNNPERGYNGLINSYTDADGDVTGSYAMARVEGNWPNESKITITPYPAITTSSNSNNFTVYFSVHNATNENYSFVITYSDGTTYSSGNQSSNATYIHRHDVSTGGKTITKIVGTGKAINFGGIRLEDGTNTFPLDCDVDCTVDTPTDAIDVTDTGVGGEFTSNYAHWNDIDLRLDNSSGTKIMNGGTIYYAAKSGYSSVTSTMPMHSGKWYCELSFPDSLPKSGNHNYQHIGICPVKSLHTYEGGHGSLYRAKDALSVDCGSSAYQASKGTGSSTTSTNNWNTSYAYDETTYLGIAIDCDNNTVKFYHDGNDLGTFPYSMTAGNSWVVFVDDWADLGANDNDISRTFLNAGQVPFRHAAPSGYKTMCNYNLPDLFSGDDLNNPGRYFHVHTYKGSGETGTKIEGIPFQPDLVWFKNRSKISNNNQRFGVIFDQVRGTSGNATGSTLFAHSHLITSDASHLTAYNSDGVTLGNSPDTNATLAKHVCWMWDFGSTAGTAASNGSLTASASWPNPTAGMEMMSYTGSNASTTIGHNLSVPMEFGLFKNISASNSWVVYHKDVDIDKHLRLNTSDDVDDYQTSIMNSTAPTNNLISLSDDSNIHGSYNYICYIFASIPGFSSIGSYYGDGLETGPMVYTGFAPEYVMIKKASPGAAHWLVYDGARGSTSTGDNTNPPFHSGDYRNPISYKYAPDIDDHFENDANVGYQASNQIMFLSNGFRLYSTTSGSNEDDKTYIYVAFAQHPQKTARAY